ncbi:MAG: prohibitin family protein [candidate division WOR-3 bacterium]|nr:prohibitin family protein [candidate division WOR-3 bacterium]
MFAIAVLAFIVFIIAMIIQKSSQSAEYRIMANRIKILALIGTVILLVASCFRIVPPGHTGIPVLLGKVLSQLRSGLNITWPIVHVELMDVRTRAYTMTSVREEGEVKGDDAIDALTSDGLTVRLDVTVWFKLDENKASWVYSNIGPDYVAKIVRPSIKTALRDGAVRYTAVGLYSTAGRTEYTAYVDSLLTNAFDGRGVIKERILLRKVALPDIVKNAIEEKLAEEQNAQKMEFTLAKQTREAERRRIEAKGISDANKEIAKSLTSNYLTWYYVDMLKTVANTQNNTFVITPFDQKLVPMLQVK